jgi:replication fork protection complex subunit Tof1/Swi1
VFKKVLDDQRSLPAGQSTKDLISCITYILRKFFKALQENPLLAVEAFWPKPRGQLRKLSGRESDEDSNSDGGLPRIKVSQNTSKLKNSTDRCCPQVPKIPADLEFKPDKEFTWSQKLGVAMRCLMDDRKVHLIMWLVEVGLDRHRGKSMVDNMIFT